jgi:Cu/Ag efflux protein CusF
MKQILWTLLAGLSVTPWAVAQQPATPADHAQHHPRTGSATAAPMAEGEVRKVDKAQAKVTLKHGEIKALDMPPMTMVFEVKDRTWLDTLKPGDKVRFSAVNEAGRYTVTALEVLR